MPSVLPDGEPVPADGHLPSAALTTLGMRGFGLYIHVPFCASRCGYCDFNTYVAAELDPGASEGYAQTVLAEVALAARVLDGAAPRVDTVFFGGGTPTLLPPGELGRILDGIDATFGFAAGAEVTTEANPESVDPSRLAMLRRLGFTRISLGMQSTAPQVLATLERRHRPGRAGAAAVEAREAGFDHVNLDLIYATPGESVDDFARSLAAAVDAGVDHISAYSLIVEDGTRLAARVRRGELPAVDDDVAADRYLAAESALSAAGFAWYEVSNWARLGGTPRSGPGGVGADLAGAQCRHNLIYWRGGDWWGFGPGAHSHIGGVRWWNVKHPRAYTARLTSGVTPAQARELLGADQRRTEEIMLRLRLAEGLALTALSPAGVVTAGQALADGLLDEVWYGRGRAVLTLRGRLLADGVVLRLLSA